MKKIYVILVNIFLLFAILIAFDTYIFYKTTKNIYKYPNKSAVLKQYLDFYSEQFTPKSSEYFYEQYILGKTPQGNEFYRTPVNEDSELLPVLLFGCSFVYGYKIPDSSIFSNVLGEYTKRPVYNRAKDGLGINLMLYQLQNEEFYKIVPKPEYVIYTFINDHQRRMFMTCVPSINYYYDIFYKIKNNKPKLAKYLNKIYSVEHIKQIYYKKNPEKYRQKAQNLALLQLLECNKLIKEHWGDTRFIVFVYTLNSEPIDTIEDKLTQAGIEVIYRKDILPFDGEFDEKYALSKNDGHPNENAWRYITPELMRAIEKNND